MRKKGGNSDNKLIFIGFILGIVALVIFLIFQFVSNALDDTTYWRMYYFKDAGTMISLADSGRGVFDLSYNTINAEKPLAFELHNNSMIQIYDIYQNSRQKDDTTFRFISDNHSEIEPSKIYSPYFNIQVTKKKVSLSTMPLRRDICDTPSTKKTPADTKIFIHTDIKDNGFLKFQFQKKLTDKGFIIARSENEEGINLSLVIIKGSDDKSISFFYKDNVRRSKKLSCIITNNYISSFPDTIYNSRFEKLNPNSDYNKYFVNSDDELVIITKNLEPDTVDNYIQGVMEYYE